MLRKCLLALAAAIQIAAAARNALAQTAARPASPDRSAAHLRRSLDGLTTTARVLFIGMHPDDELPELSTWLSRGRHVETAYLFVTRGEAGEDFTGPETGPSLGAVRVGEALNARRIDGAHQYFTRAFDFGPVRSADEVFIKRVDTAQTGNWERDSIVAEVVTVIRAFRPHVIIGVPGDTIAAGNGQHLALTDLLNAAFSAAGDSTRFDVRQFGAPWPAAKLYRVGPGIRIGTNELDRVTGRRFTSIAADVRAQQRSQGTATMAHAVRDTVSLELIASRVNRDRPDASLFDAVDTSFARLAPDSAAGLSRAIRRIRAIADSLSPLVGASAVADAVQPLAEIAQLASSVRHLATSCRHAALSAALSVISDRASHVCDPAELDRDAAADLLHDRANDALLAAAGIEIAATSDHELLASGDTATVTVSITNHGTAPLRVGALSVSGAITDTASPRPIDIAPHASIALVRQVVRVAPVEPWWIGNREVGRFPPVLWPLDGLSRPAPPSSILAPAEAIPEEIRRATDVSLLLEIEGATITTSIGPALYHYTDPIVGVQYRELSGAPEVTIRFARALEWFPIAKPVARALHVKVKSHADHRVVLGLGKAAEPGINVDALPKEVTLEPHEQRELLLPIRGRISEQAREQFLFWGVTDKGITYQTGLQPVERPYLEPRRITRNTGAFFQGVDIKVPASLIVFYIPEDVDDLRSTLTQVGVTARELSPDILLTADLSHVSTVVLAPHAVERFPEIATQANRLLDFVRRGGTLVIQRGTDSTLTSKLLPFPVALATPAEAVLHPDAPVRAIDPRARLLTWPNRITQKDWNTWLTARADALPTVADPRYERVIETHDPGQPENRNAILVARLGKGRVIYTSLTFDQQIAGASTGALRLFVNLLSAGLPQ